MSKIPFTVYDFFAYLSSGAVVVATVDYLHGYQWILREKLTVVLGVALIFAAYITGHAVAHFSSWLLEQQLIGRVLSRPGAMLLGQQPRLGIQKWLFPGYCKALPSSVQTRVKEQAEARGCSASGEGLFLHAYAIVTANDRAQARLDEFRNLYGFSRNMAFAFVVAAVLLGASWWRGRSVEIGWWAVVSTGFAMTMFYRYLKFFRQFSYQLFITYAELQRPETKNPNVTL